MSGYVEPQVIAPKRAYFSTRRIVVTAILTAVTLVLSLTPLGFIPVPTAAGNATIMHIPTIIGAIMEGPVVGGFIGLVFGITSFVHGTIPAFKDPLVSVVPRILIGIVAYFVYMGVQRIAKTRTVAYIVSGIVGSLTNTFLVLLSWHFLQIKPLMTWRALWVIVVAQGIPEAIGAAVITTAVLLAYTMQTRIGKKSKISQA